MTKAPISDERVCRSGCFRHFRQAFVSGCFDESFRAEVVDSTLYLLSLYLSSLRHTPLFLSPENGSGEGERSH